MFDRASFALTSTDQCGDGFQKKCSFTFQGLEISLKKTPQKRVGDGFKDLPGDGSICNVGASFRNTIRKASSSSLPFERN